MVTKVSPKIIQEVGFYFDWDEKKVWALKLPIENMEISYLEWMFDIPFWNSNGGYYDLSPNQVLANPEKYKEEYARIMKANLKYPIDIMFNKGRWLILDGLHRLVKAKVQGMKKVNVRKVPRSDIPKIKP